MISAAKNPALTASAIHNARRQRGLSSACVALLAQLDSLQQSMADHLDSFKLTRHMHPVATTGSSYDR
jgi:hypothetical protein